MSLKNLSQNGGHWIVDGERQSCLVGRDAFKLLMYVANGESNRAERWVDRNLEIFGPRHVERVLGETGGWGGHPMFGSYPKDPGIWDLDFIRKQLDKEARPIKQLTSLNKEVLQWMCDISQRKGVVFEYNCLATLKHTMWKMELGKEKWLTTGVGDHAIRQTAAYFRELISVPGAPYPGAMIIFNACNEWGAHNKWRYTVKKVNDLSDRFYRWSKERPEGGYDHKIQFKSPGPEWVAEQWPEGFITIDGTTGHDLGIGPKPGNFKSALEHPQRDRVRWWDLPDTYDQLVADARGTPWGYNESKMSCQRGEEDRLSEWYGPGGNSRASWTTDLDHYMQWLETCKRSVRIMIIHDETGMQADGDAPQTDLERELGGFEPPPPPPPSSTDTNYRPVISAAYRDYLDRRRNADGSYGDRGGLDGKNHEMNERIKDGASFAQAKAEMEETIIQAPEYKRKHPSGA